jgi:asparagine synthase (glutamine-hydrolysing)
VRDLLRGLGALSRPNDERYAVMLSHFVPESLEALCEERFLAEGGGADRPWSETLSPGPLRGIDRYLALDTATYLPGDLLTKVDRMSMANSLEVRSPFLDYRVAEYAASLPPGLKLRRLQTKWPLKQLALRRGLPRDLVHRRKQGFGVPVGDWFRGELRGWLEGIVLDPSALARGYFRPEEVRRLVADHTEGRADHDHRLWNLAMLELWHRNWIDGG